MPRAKDISEIHIKGAREHNLRDLELRIPRNQLVVITGVSGSGKSSLAFDTLYAEGYRKYMDSLSSRARQLLDQIKRPDVDYIHGLSPVIAIEQRSAGGGNPRSTVATATEIADYARILWSVCGEQYCPIDGGRIERQSLDDCITRIFQEPENCRMILLAPYMTARPALLREELPRILQRGFQRIRVNGELCEIDDPNAIPPGRDEVVVEIVVDRLVLKKDQRSRVADSLELAFREGGDRALVMVQDDRESPWREFSLSQHLASNKGGTVYEPLTPRHFSWNHPEGACPECGGLGQVLRFQEQFIVPDDSKSVRGGAIKPWRMGSKAMIIKRNAILKQLAEQLPFEPTVPWKQLDEVTRRILMHGAGERLFSLKLKSGNRKPELMKFEGVLADLEETRRNTSSEGLRTRLMAYQSSSECPVCRGKRLSPRALHVLLEGNNYADFLQMSISQALGFTQGLLKKKKKYASVSDALNGLVQRLAFLSEVGLGYLTLERAYSTLSGGEVQRVRLATQLGMGLVGVAYVLDEPSIGLHPADHERLIGTMLNLRDRGNAVIVVEHDDETMRQADHLIELGPGAGTLGGKIIFEGTPQECMSKRKTRTGLFLSGELEVGKEAAIRRPDNRFIKVTGASENNLKQVDASFPVGLLTVVCGVSGSGKSTLVNDVLARAAAFKLNRAKTIPGKHDKVEGLEHFVSTVRVDQEPIGRSPRSNPATYVKLFDPLRQLFAKCPLAKIRGYSASRFSFNVRGGRCEKCQGDGQIKLDMQFLGDVFVECPSCHGKRYNRETLEVRFKGYNIADVLDMTVDDARNLFRHQPPMLSKLETLSAVGLGYLTLGQSANTLSGGEAQRIKLSLELSKRSQGETLYILDEPTTGLHWDDVQKLMDLLFKLRDAGNTIIIIEHHMDVVRLADWLVELGPGGGIHGGDIVFCGTTSELARADTATGRALKATLARSNTASI